VPASFLILILSSDILRGFPLFFALTKLTAYIAGVDVRTVDRWVKGANPDQSWLTGLRPELKDRRQFDSLVNRIWKDSVTGFGETN
jgi:hypothetical protein